MATFSEVLLNPLGSRKEACTSHGPQPALMHTLPKLNASLGPPNSPPHTHKAKATFPTTQKLQTARAQEKGITKRTLRGKRRNSAQTS